MADELLKALGRLQRAQQAESAAEGPRADFTDDLRRPLDAAEQADMLAAVLGPATASPAGAGATVLPLARPPRRRWLAGVSTLAAAAALFLVLRPGDDAGALPSYAITQARGEAVVRGDEPAPTAPLVVRPGTVVELIAAPASAAAGPVDLRVVASQGEQRRWLAVDAVRTASADGVLRLRGRADAWLDLPPGAWTLSLVIARPDRLPADLAAYTRGADDPRAHGWQVQQVQVQIEP